MRVCDRCGTPITATTLLDKRTGSEFDLCKACLEDFSEFLRPKVEKEEDKPKKKGGK